MEFGEAGCAALGYPQKRGAQGTFARAMAALCALVRMYQMTTTATRASIHVPPTPPRRNLHLHCGIRAHRSSPYTYIAARHKNNPPCISKLTPNPVSSSRPPHTCIVAFLSIQSSISQHITPNSHFHFQPPAYITNTHTPPSVPIVSPSLAL